MKPLHRLRPSPAMVVACIALSVALGGTSYAAITLPRNSVGTTQLKKNAVTSPKVKNNAITGADVLESSLGRVPSAVTAVTATSATQAATAGTAAPSGPAAGGLAGTYPNPTIGADAVGGANIVDASAAAGLRRADLGVVVATVAFNPASIPAHSCSSDSEVVTGAQTGDLIVLQPVDATWTDLIWAPWTVSGNNVHLRICNPTASAVDGSGVSFNVILIR